MKLTFWALARHHSLSWRANPQNTSFETLYRGQFTSSTQLIIPKSSCYTPPLMHHHMESYPLYSWLVLGLFLIGQEGSKAFLNQSQSLVKQKQSLVIFDTHLKIYHSPGWRDTLWEFNVFLRNTAQWSWPRSEPGTLDLQSTILTTKPKHLL